MAVMPLFLLVAGSAAVAGLARRTPVPAPLLLVTAGLAASYIPGIPDYTLDPHIVLPLLLPPLLHTAALDSSYLGLRANLRPVALLSVGYVLFATFVVGYAAYLVIPGLPLTAALVLGAVVAPPDAVAATAIARKLGLPHRITTILQGESLFNDATAITAYKVLVAVALGAGASWGDGIKQFAIASVGGIGVGLLLMVPLHWLRVRLRESALLENTLSLLIPFVAYAAAEQLHASGVLAVVVVGLYLGHRSWQVDFETRLQEDAVWKMVSFILESAVFALIGLQLPVVVRGLGSSAGRRPSGTRPCCSPSWSCRGSCGSFPGRICRASCPPGSVPASRTRSGPRRSSSAGPGCAGWCRWPSRSPSRPPCTAGRPSRRATSCSS